MPDSVALDRDPHEYHARLSSPYPNETTRLSALPWTIAVGRTALNRWTRPLPHKAAQELVNTAGLVLDGVV